MTQKYNKEKIMSCACRSTNDWKYVYAKTCCPVWQFFLFQNIQGNILRMKIFTGISPRFKKQQKATVNQIFHWLLWQNQINLIQTFFCFLHQQYYNSYFTMHRFSKQQSTWKNITIHYYTHILQPQFHSYELYLKRTN